MLIYNVDIITIELQQFDIYLPFVYLSLFIRWL